MEMEEGFSNSAAVVACTAMTFLYVAILYAPTVILRLPSPSSFTQFLIRRFVCVCVSSILCLLVSSLILIPIRDWNMLTLIDVYGVRADHLWQAVIFPLALTSLMYPGSLVLNFLLVFECWRETGISGILQRYRDWLLSLPCNIMAWRNYVVAPLTEELVFRACMIPLLLCGGFKPQNVIFLCPVFFSLSIQLMYTVVFGSYASFVYIRTGHLAAPLVAHIFCNFMGLPVSYCFASIISYPPHGCPVSSSSLYFASPRNRPHIALLRLFRTLFTVALAAHKDLQLRHGLGEVENRRLPASST